MAFKQREGWARKIEAKRHGGIDVARLDAALGQELGDVIEMQTGRRFVQDVQQALAGVDPALAGRDRLPSLKEVGQVVNARATNWTIVPCPHPAWASLVYPQLDGEQAYERLWQELWHVLRLDEPDPGAAWDDRTAALRRTAARIGERRFDALELRGPGTKHEEARPSLATLLRHRLLLSRSGATVRRFTGALARPGRG